MSDTDILGQFLAHIREIVKLEPFQLEQFLGGEVVFFCFGCDFLFLLCLDLGNASIVL